VQAVKPGGFVKLKHPKHDQATVGMRDQAYAAICSRRTRLNIPHQQQGIFIKLLFRIPDPHRRVYEITRRLTVIRSQVPRQFIRRCRAAVPDSVDADKHVIP
jgi:hypothetical protein